MTDQPETLTLPDFIEVAGYRHDHGHQAWAWRCWGNGDCDGWLSLDHNSQGSADRSAHKHLAESHADVVAALDPQEQPTTPPTSAGDRLPDDVLALLLLRSYLSTACETARVVDAATIRHPENPHLPAWVETLHQRCRRTQKYTGVACYCTCHQPASTTPTQEQP